MTLMYDNSNELIETEVIIENSKFSHSKAQYGGGVEIIFYDVSGSIEISHCIIYNNTAQIIGEGVTIYLFNRTSSIEISNYTIYNNTVQYVLGLIAFQVISTRSIHFTNVSFQFNKLPNKLNMYQSAVLLMNIENVILAKLTTANLPCI